MDKRLTADERANLLMGWKQKFINGRMTGLCPFHQEKTPSSFLDMNTGKFYCFGCGKDGEAQEFYERLAELEKVKSDPRLIALLGASLGLLQTKE